MHAGLVWWDYYGTGKEKILFHADLQADYATQRSAPRIVRIRRGEFLAFYLL
jgi:hypothetical protein